MVELVKQAVKIQLLVKITRYLISFEVYCFCKIKTAALT